MWLPRSEHFILPRPVSLALGWQSSYRVIGTIGSSITDSIVEAPVERSGFWFLLSELKEIGCVSCRHLPLSTRCPRLHYLTTWAVYGANLFTISRGWMRRCAALDTLNCGFQIKWCLWCIVILQEAIIVIMHREKRISRGMR